MLKFLTGKHLAGKGLHEVILVTELGENGDMDTGEEVARFVKVMEA